MFTPVSRRHFDETGKYIIPSHGEYPTAIIQVATEYGLPLIDATKITEEWLNSIGDEASRQYFMWLEPGEYVKHPDGLKDNTHLLKMYFTFLQLFYNYCHEEDICMLVFAVIYNGKLTSKAKERV